MRRWPSAPAGAEDGAHERVSLKVQGDEVSGYRVFIHVPEEWVRRQEQTTLSDAAEILGWWRWRVVCDLRFCGFLSQSEGSADGARAVEALGTWMLVAPVGGRRGVCDHGAAVSCGIHDAGALQGFSGDHADRSVVWVLLFYYAVAVFLFGLAWFFLTRAYGLERLSGVVGMPARYYRDALAIGIGGALALAGLGRLAALLARVWVVPQRELATVAPQGLDFSWPALHALGAAVNYSLIAVGVLALALGFAACYLRNPWMQTALLVACAVVASPGWGSAGDFVQKRLVVFAALALIWWGSRRIARFNLLGYLLVALLLALAVPAADLLKEPNPFYRGNGCRRRGCGRGAVALAAGGVDVALRGGLGAGEKLAEKLDVTRAACGASSVRTSSGAC